MQISIDASFMAHVLIPGQRTAEAMEAALEMTLGEHRLLGSSGLFLEFPSILRKVVNAGRLTAREAGRIFDEFMVYPIAVVPPVRTLQRRA